MDNFTIYLNGNLIKANPSETVLDVAKQHNVFIPTLCYLKDALNLGRCGICLVEIEYNGELTIKRACCTKIKNGMKISTSSKNVIKAIKSKLSDILSNHDFRCSKCTRKSDCELFKLVLKYKTGPKTRYNLDIITEPNYLDERSSSIIINRHRCIQCGRCSSTCRTKTLTSSILLKKENNKFTLKTNDNKCMDDTNCLLCGQCVSVCPVGALTEKSHTDKVISAIQDPKKHVIVAIAPSVRASIGEAFDMGYGIDVTGKLYTSLRKLGFDKIFDLNFGADLTIMEEASEFIHRLHNSGPFPMFTSCCPGWIRQAEHYFKELLPNLSSTKSPQQIFGAATKTYYPHIMNLNPSDIFTVTIMPCTAKKFESQRSGMSTNGLNDIDAVLTANELIKLLKDNKIDFKTLEDSICDPFMAEYSGAGAIFGSTGGVMEAALRTTKDLLENKSFQKINYNSVRGFDGIKESTVSVNGINLNIAVINGSSNMFKFIKSDALHKKQYHFIEVMCCEGGCINGGGHPHVSSHDRETIDYKILRSSVLYKQDIHLSKRKSHENKSLIEMYKNYIGKPGNTFAHKLFHIFYNKK